MASINPGLEGQILISTDGDGLKIYDESTGLITQSNIRTYEYNLATSNVKDAIVDSDGNMGRSLLERRIGDARHGDQF